MLNHATVTAFNEMWFRKAPRRRIGEIVSIPGFFHPLDVVGSWNRLYGRRRLRAVPVRSCRSGQEAALRRVVERLAGVRHAELPRRAQALRRRQPGAAQLPGAGLDAGARRAGGDARPGRAARTGSTTLVLDAGGRHYLAKDAHTTPDGDPPRLPAPRRVAGRPRRRSIPTGVWASDLSRRLRLLDD